MKSAGDPLNEVRRVRCRAGRPLAIGTFVTTAAPPSPLPRELLSALLALIVAVSGVTGCATSSLPTAPTSAPGTSGASPSPEPTSMVLLRLRQTQHGVPAVQRQALWPWIANVGRAEPMHRIESDPVPADIAAQGWIAWRLPEGSYQVVIAGYETSGAPPRILLDRYRFQVHVSERALYLASVSYACEPAWWFEALCPQPATIVDDLVAAEMVAAQLGTPGVSRARFEKIPSSGSRQPGTELGRIPQLAASETLLMVGDGHATRTVYDFLAQARSERTVPAEVGAQVLIRLAPLGPLAIVVALPAAALTGAGVAIHHEHLSDKAQCLQRIWDERSDTVARRSLDAALRRLADGSANIPARSSQALIPADASLRYRRLLALDVQRLGLDSCHPSQPWLPDPRSKRFCVEAAIRARVYATGSEEPLSDEIFAVVPHHRVGHEFEPTGWPIPPEYLYETPLSSRAGLERTYEEYCGADGFALVESDLSGLLEAMVRELLALHGIRQ